MGVATMRVPTVFTAVDRFSGVVAGMSRTTKGFASGMQRVDRQINKQFGSLREYTQLAAAGVAGALFYSAGKDIVEYEKSIKSLGAVTGTTVGSMNKEIESLGKETGRSVIDIAKGFETIGSKMSEYLKNPVALKEIAKQSILMSDASRMSVEDSTENLTSLLNQFKLSYTQANRVINKLSSGEDVGASTIAESADVVRQFAASARMAGANLEETIALVQATTKTLGKDGVGRGFRNIMVDLNTGKGMDKNKRRALLMVKADLDKIVNPSTKFIDKLREIKKLLSNKQAMGMFFKKTNFETGATFLGSFDMFEKYLKFIESNNTAQLKATKNNSSFAKSWLDLKNAFTNYVVSGNRVNIGLEKMKGLLKFVRENLDKIIDMALSVVVVFIGWKVIYGIISTVSLILSAFTSVLEAHRFVVLWATLTNTSYATSLGAVATATLAAYWPILLVVGALGLLAYAFWKSGKSAEDMVNKQISAITKGDNAVKKSTMTLRQELNTQLALRLNALKKIAPVGGSLTPAQQKYNDIVDKKIANIKADNSSKINNALSDRFKGARLEYKNVNSMLRYVQKGLVNNPSVRDFEQKQLTPGMKELMKQGMTFNELEQLYPSKLTTLQEKKQQLEIILRDTNGIVEEIKPTNGTSVIIKSTLPTKK